MSFLDNFIQTDRNAEKFVKIGFFKIRSGDIYLSLVIGACFLSLLLQTGDKYVVGKSLVLTLALFSGMSTFYGLNVENDAVCLKEQENRENLIFVAKVIFTILVVHVVSVCLSIFLSAYGLTPVPSFLPPIFN